MTDKTSPERISSDDDSKEKEDVIDEEIFTILLYLQSLVIIDTSTYNNNKVITICYKESHIFPIDKKNKSLTYLYFKFLESSSFVPEMCRLDRKEIPLNIRDLLVKLYDKLISIVGFISIPEYIEFTIISDKLININVKIDDRIEYLVWNGNSLRRRT